MKYFSAIFPRPKQKATGGEKRVKYLVVTSEGDLLLLEDGGLEIEKSGGLNQWSRHHPCSES